ncbi:MAG: folate-binding protein [Alphaproteobacteria bacterium]|nr:folate-binding protein [Alphaproteobacteria bacterium]
MKAAFVERGALNVAGEDARDFLNRLVTTDIGRLRPGLARFGALLTPQGKILVDFLITQTRAVPDSFRIDCPAFALADLAARLALYRLRARVAIEPASDSTAVLALWDGAPPPLSEPCVAFADPRHPRLGFRILLPAARRDELAAIAGAGMVASSAYEAHRIACGVPQSGVDFASGELFPHEANMDLLHGIDFDKGCYIGQEVVSRMQHRGTTRSRCVNVRIEGPALEAATEVFAGDRRIGTVGPAQHKEAIACLRIDRVREARDANTALVTAAGQILHLREPEALAALISAAPR